LGMELTDFKTGDRVQIQPATSYWMRGARYGTVMKVAREMVHVRLNSLNKIVRFDPELILEIVK